MSEETNKLSTGLKEYYSNIQALYTNAVNMMSALNQSLTSNSSKVYVSLIDSAGNTYSRIQLPSLLYLENRLEELQTTIDDLFNITTSGEAWFSKSADMFKLQLVKSNSAPVTPTFASEIQPYASSTENTFLKDLVTPKAFLKVGISNLPENVESMFMKKIVFKSSDIFRQIQSMDLKSYEEYKAALYTLRKGIDYDEYDSKVDLPVKSDRYNSSFKIVDIPNEIDGVENPRYRSGASLKLTYILSLDTLLYHDKDDTSIEYTLSKGDKIGLINSASVYQVKNVDLTQNTVEIEEYIGRTSLTTFENNSQMEFQIYNESYSEFNYVQVPLEENQYVAIFLGTIYNNIRSILSEPMLIDLSQILMYDEFGNKILDSFGHHMNYLEYYEKYCVNIGDLILGMTESTYPQLSNYDTEVLYNLQNGEDIQSIVTQTLNIEEDIQVVPINKHLIDQTTTEEIINLHSQKSDLNSQLNILQENIDNVYSTLLSTDFSQEIDLSQQSLKSKLQEYYAQRITLQKQLNSVISNINAISSDVTIAKEKTKYRIRGVTKVEILENYVHTMGNSKLDIIGLEVEYKYKSILKDTTSVTNINSTLFTDWNRLDNIDKQRKLVFNDAKDSFNVEYVDYSSTQNIIKWNQIDIPITNGEDVIIRIRYKYNVGQPFINIYSPWSDELTIAFPAEYLDNVEVSTILEVNEDDMITAKFRETLLNEGYQEHINNALTVNNTTFYHMPENVYSGFNTPENNMINLKDKLTEMSIDIENTKSMLEYNANKKYTVYLNYDDGNVQLFNNNINRVNIYNTDHINDSFVKKKMNIIIKNTGDVNVRLYSVFPGNTDIPLILSNNEFYEKYIQHYERVPMFSNGVLVPQTLGQWIYFRQDNPYTGELIYNDDITQDLKDYRDLNDGAERCTFIALNSYIKKDYSQALLAYRKRNEGEIRNIVDVSWVGLDFSEETNSFTQLHSILNLEDTTLEQYSKKGIEFFMYQEDFTNNYLNRFEDVCGINDLGEKVYLDEHTSIPEFIALNTVNGITAGTNTLCGAFFYPDLLNKSSILTDGTQRGFVEIEVGKSLTIPVTFEYSLDGELVTKITKALYFDIRDSLDYDPQHYMVELTANYDYSSTGSLINSGFGL